MVNKGIPQETADEILGGHNERFREKLLTEFLKEARKKSMKKSREKPQEEFLKVNREQSVKKARKKSQEE